MKEKLALTGFLLSLSFLFNGVIRFPLIFLMAISEEIYSIADVTLSLISILLTIISLIIGIVVLVKKKPGKGLAIASVVVSSLILMLFIFWIFIWIFAF